MNTIFCNHALTQSGWKRDVTIGIEDGLITSIETGGKSQNADMQLDVAVPGMPNLHSHAHQRAMAGLGEVAGPNADSFWSWRTVMYHYLEQIGPDDLYAIARQLYLEMLKAGYTHVAEFQYLHHDINGARFANPAEMTLQCQRAALDTGIGFTALPVLYRYGGFGEADTSDAQKRFLNDARGFVQIVDAIRAEQQDKSNLALGIAPHSLRAVSEALLGEVLGAVDETLIHIHIAEQAREVEECLQWSGQRPVEWLLEHFDVNPNWCLIHATHMTEDETRHLAKSGAVAGLCPTTEANLGDGFFNAESFCASGGRWGIGSDSQISVSPVEELRWLEYGLRLKSQQRNILSGQVRNTGASLYQQALAGGTAASGCNIGSIAVGRRADIVALDSQHPRLSGRLDNSLLDSWVFSGNENPVNSVLVGGHLVIDRGHHDDEDEVAEVFRRVLHKLAGN